MKPPRDAAAEAYMIDTIIEGGNGELMEGCLADFKAGWDAHEAHIKAQPPTQPCEHDYDQYGTCEKCAAPYTTKAQPPAAESAFDLRAAVDASLRCDAVNRSGIELFIDGAKYGHERQAERVRLAEAERDRLEYNLACLLSHVTGGLLSKTNYTKEAMYEAADDYFERKMQDAVAELEAELAKLQKVCDDDAGDNPYEFSQYASALNYEIDQRDKEIVQLEAEVARCGDLLEAAKFTYDFAEENKRLRKALEFYASLDDWGHNHTSDTTCDFGERARQALTSTRAGAE